MLLNNMPVYMCERDRDDGAGKLVLFFKDDAFWTAVSVGIDVTSADEILVGRPQFQAANRDDIRQPGKHSWRCSNPQTGGWWPASNFQTVSLD